MLGSNEKPSERFGLSDEALDFAPGLLAIQERPPEKLPRAVLYLVCALCITMLGWACIGKLDMIATAEGRLIPATYVKIVQPSDAGIVHEILVEEGQRVSAGQVLIRMDPQDAHADETSLRTQLMLRRLQLRRIDAELSGQPLKRSASEPSDLFQRVESQYLDRRQSYADQLAEAQRSEERADREFRSSQETLIKLNEITPLLKDQADAYQEMGKDGYVPALQVQEKRRDYLEKAQEAKAQLYTVQSLESAVEAARRQVGEVNSKYRSDLQNERVDAEGEFRKLEQQLAKQVHKGELLELRAPQAGIVKELATHTIGTVVQPGTVIVSLVPENEPLMAEVMVRNEDIGFVYPSQSVKLKLAAYPFQKYGLLDGKVTHVEADAVDENAESSKAKPAPTSSDDENQHPTYRALVALASQHLEAQDESFKLVPGMQVSAEINQGTRTVLEYLLSPVRKTLHESGHER